MQNILLLILSSLVGPSLADKSGGVLKTSSTLLAMESGLRSVQRLTKYFLLGLLALTLSSVGLCVGAFDLAAQYDTQAQVYWSATTSVSLLFFLAGLGIGSAVVTQMQKSIDLKAQLPVPSHELQKAFSSALHSFVDGFHQGRTEQPIPQPERPRPSEISRATAPNQNTLEPGVH